VAPWLGVPPTFFSELRILKELQGHVFGSAHSKGLSTPNRGTAHSKELSGTKEAWGRGEYTHPRAIRMVIKTKGLRNLIVVSC